jgi:hypothetical protein
MNVDPEKLGRLYCYNPPTDDERKEKHKKANDAVANCAIALAECFDTPENAIAVFELLQMVRMKSNAIITHESIGMSYWGIFDDVLTR